MDGHPTTTTVYRGPCCTIRFAVGDNAKMPASDFFYHELNDKQQRKFMALFTRMGDHGKIHDEEKFKHEQDKLYAFKIFKARIYCFRDGNDWVLTNGCFKKSNKADPNEIARATRIMNEAINRS